MAKAMGQPLSRVDGRLKVTGAAPYAADMKPTNLAHAVVVCSTVGKGKIIGIDDAAAKAAPGVLAVLTHLNAPKMKATKAFDPSARPPKASASSANVLQTDEIFWDGQPVAVVVAETFEQARDASLLVRVSYQKAAPRFLFDAHIKDAFIPKAVNGEKPEIKIGDAEKALAGSAFKVDQVYRTPREIHSALEPHATTASWTDAGVEIDDASQYVAGVQEMVAEKFDLKIDKVRVRAKFVGGGFGSKGTAWPHVALAVAASKAVGRPVRLALTREHCHRTTGFRTATEMRVALGCDAAGKLQSLIHTGTTSTSTTNLFTEQFTFPARHLYASPNIFLQQKIVELDVVPPTFMRAPGEAPGSFALESALDELAVAANWDPVELRIVNEPTEDPTKKSPFSSRHLPEALRLGAEKFGWRNRPARPAKMKDGVLLRGMGVATAYYPAYQMPCSARVVFSQEGQVKALASAHEMGMGTATVQAQNVADALGVGVERVTFIYGDTNLPPAPVAGGSSTTISVGAALRAACDTLRKKAVALAASGNGGLGGSKEKDLEYVGGTVHRRDDPNAFEDVAAVLKRLGIANLEAEESVLPSAASMKFSLGSYGGIFVEVSVDPELGVVRVTRALGVYDCGTILNPKTARSQFVGGIIMGIGMALMEEQATDPRTGRVMNPNLGEYHIPVQADLPSVEALWLDHPDPVTPMGARGIGEIGITVVAAAVANAFFHATGVRIREVPLSPDRVLAALSKAK